MHAARSRMSCETLHASCPRDGQPAQSCQRTEHACSVCTPVVRHDASAQELDRRISPALKRLVECLNHARVIRCRLRHGYDWSACRPEVLSVTKRHCCDAQVQPRNCWPLGCVLACRTADDASTKQWLKVLQMNRRDLRVSAERKRRAKDRPLTGQHRAKRARGGQLG